MSGLFSFKTLLNKNLLDLFYGQDGWGHGGQYGGGGYNGGGYPGGGGGHSGGGHAYNPKKPYANLKYLEAREADGHNNDGDGDNSNDKGYHDSTFSRFTNSYTDGGSLPLQNSTAQIPGPPVEPPIFDPSYLPEPRAITNAVMNQGTADIPNSYGVNEFFQFFGQVLTHDIAEAATGVSGDDPNITNGEQGINLSGFFPFGFNRTPYETGTGTDNNNPRQQINEETSFLDLSMVYGNKDELLDLARADLRDKHGNKVVDQYGNTVQSAKLLMGEQNLLPTIQQVANDSGLTAFQVLQLFTAPGFGGLPDPNDGEENIVGQYETDFFAGDNRVNQTPLLISQQLIWAREHNYQVDKLAPYAKKYGWTQDELFDAARAITEAEWQKVVYDEYLPKLLGKNAMGAYEGYKSYIDPSIINEFTTIAFRFGHDQSSQTQQPLNEDGSNATPGGLTLFTLVTAFAAGADAARTTDDVDAWIRGQLSAYTQEIDGLVVDGNRNALFGTGAPFPVDLEVLDIMRARDHGVWNYNALREGMGLETYSTFDQYGAANNLDPARLAALKAVYGDDITKLDAIIGGLLEEKFYDSQLGKTFTLLIAQQFENLRDGDRFYYEERLKHDPKLLAEIEATTLADILARTTGIDHIYRDAFAAHDRISDFDNDKKIEGSAKLDLVVGSDYGEVIKTYGGADDIYGGKGNDKIFAGGGNDWIWTGDGKDILVFDDYAGHDVVKDFSVKYDKLDLTDYGIDSWKDARKIIKHSSDGIVLKLDDDTSVKLVGVKQLTTKNFIYDDAYDYGVA